MYRRLDSRDSGFTLIEVIVAVAVFAVISTGVIASTITISRMSADNRARIVATNLAAQATDGARLVADPFSIGNATSTQTVGGRTYTIVRTAAWVDSTGTDATCGASTSLLYKRVSVAVTWRGQAVTTQPVRSDTLLATTRKVTDASSGAILVSVQDASGAGESGVSVTITPSAGAGSGSALASQPAATDADGCTYATTVSPGNYDIKLTMTGYRDNKQVAQPVLTRNVTAGATVSASFQYDAATTYTIVHAGNASRYSLPSTPLLPTNMTTTLVPVVGTETVNPVLVTNTGTSATAFPAPAGYSAVAGELTTADGTTRCAALDPGAWPGSLTGTPVLAAGSRGAAQPALSGGSAAVRDTMGLVTVRASAAATLVATPNNAVLGVPGGNPGCAQNASLTPLTFGAVLTNGTITIALPYGSWTLSSTGSTSALVSATPVSNTIGGTTAVTATTTLAGKTVSLTLDPRAAS